MTASAPDPVLETAKAGGWKSWLPKVILTVLGIALAYFIFDYMASNFGGFEKGVQAAFSMPALWTGLAIVAAIVAIGVYPLTAPAAIPGLKYEAAFVDRQGGFAISTTIPFGGGPIAVATQYAILARYGVQQRLAAAAVAADAIWTYLMTFGAPGVALVLLWVFERRTLTGNECGAIPCDTIDIIIIIAGVVCLLSMAGIAFVLRSRSNAQKVGDFAQGALGRVFRLIKRTPPNVVESVVGFNDTAAEMVGKRWLPITITNVLAQLTPMFVVLAALRGVGAGGLRGVLRRAAAHDRAARPGRCRHRRRGAHRHAGGLRRDVRAGGRRRCHLAGVLLPAADGARLDRGGLLRHPPAARATQGRGVGLVVLGVGGHLAVESAAEDHQ